MASPSIPLKRANATVSPVKDDNKRARSSTDESSMWDDAAASDSATTSDNMAPFDAEKDTEYVIWPREAPAWRYHEWMVTGTVPRGYIVVWAHGRQALCECNPDIFQAHQSGLYSKNNIAISILIDGFTEPRDFLYHNSPYALITTVGGKRVQYNGKEPTRGEKVVHTIRSDGRPSAVKIMENSIGLAVTVIIGRDHPQFKDLILPPPIPADARYVELGTFRLVDCWKEYVQPEGVDRPYPVWRNKWLPILPDLPVWYWRKHYEVATMAPKQALEPCPRQVCEHCGLSYPVIFDNGPWVCLNESCEHHWKTNGRMLGQSGDDGNDLRYSQSFLSMAEPMQGKMQDLQQDIRQMFEPLPALLDKNGTLCGTEKELRRGFACPRCGRANAKIFWDKYECGHCHFIQIAIPHAYPMDKIQTETDDLVQKIQKKHGSHALADGVTIRCDPSHVDSFTIIMPNHTKLFIFMIKNSESKLIGAVVLERPDDDSKKASCGADKLLEMIQADGGQMGLRRNAARCADTSSEVLSRHYQSNFGVPYEFGVKLIPSTSFEDSPDVVLMALAMLTDVGKRAWEQVQKLAKEQGYTSVDGSTLFKPYEPYNELLALAYRETDRISWHDDGEDQVRGVISTASLGSPATMGIRLKGDKKAGPVLELHVRHGDVVTMCDTRLQAFTEHKVDSEGVRRYAVTSRAIGIDYYKSPKLASKLDKLGTSVEQMEAGGRLPDRARQFRYGNTTLGDVMHDGQDGGVVPDGHDGNIVVGGQDCDVVPGGQDGGVVPDGHDGNIVVGGQDGISG